jgi:hypothetical protein
MGKIIMSDERFKYESLLENYDKDKVIEYLNERQRVAAENDALVQSREYLDWIKDVLVRKTQYNDEYALYDKDEIDNFNGSKLNYFMSYITKLANEQRIMNVPNIECMFEEANYVVRIDDVFVEVSLMVGQGAITFIQIVDKPNYAYVVLPNNERNE